MYVLFRLIDLSMLPLLVLFYSLSTSVLGQDASDGCLSLLNSKACPAFSEFYVGVPGLAERYPFLYNITDILSFDESLLAYVHSTADYLAPLQCTHQAYTTKIPYARYSLTRICTGLVQDPDYSLPCSYKVNQAPPPLCEITCENYMDSVTQITSDISLCPDQAQKDALLLTLKSQCTTWQGYNGTGNCIMGAANEPDNCGFGNDTTSACSYCKNNNDTCCQYVNTCRALSNGALAGIVVACLAVVAIIISFFYLCYRRKHIHKNNFSFTTYIPPPKNIPSHESDPRPPYGSHAGSSGHTLTAYHDKQRHSSLHRRSLPIETSPFMTHEELEEEHVMAQQLAVEELFEVVHPYPPQMADELGLHVGDIVCLAMRFDDGWALGFNVTTGLKGVFPMVCIALASEELLERLLQTADIADEEHSHH
ncbi:hypothetical protein BDF14DRAFT_1748770 [Spinellus fusiger]|nr:hypothetical protein BDF14DRAFT_1748770 [Spinellus fusiger]